MRARLGLPLVVAFSLGRATDMARQGRDQVRPGDYRVAVVNKMNHPMDVSYSDVDTLTEHFLGIVDGLARSEFTIAAPAQTDIYLTERAEAMPGYVRRIRVTLQPDSVVEVLLL